MSRLPAPLTATLVGAACCLSFTTVALATPGTSEARTGTVRHRSRHAHSSCRASHKHRHKQPRHCPRSDSPRRHRSTPAHARGAARSDKPPTTVTISLPSASATIASVLATPCQNTELTPETDNLQAIREATMCLVNQERARNGELPLQPNTELAEVAQQHSEDMVSKDYFSHTTPSGETQQDRVLASGYIPNSQVGYTIGENIAWGTLYLATPSSIVAAWIASPEHLANILNAEYSETGIGIDPAGLPSLAEGQPGAIYTQEFGVISS
jgi:uncharacterized protein YkwD